MVKSKTEIMEAIKSAFKDDTSDSTLTFIEDVADTLDDLDTKASSNNEWQKKYEDNDKAWREKYKERFFSAPVNEPAVGSAPSTQVEQDDTPKSFDDLFTVGGK